MRAAAAPARPGAPGAAPKACGPSVGARCGRADCPVAGGGVGRGLPGAAKRHSGGAAWSDEPVPLGAATCSVRIRFAAVPPTDATREQAAMGGGAPGGAGGGARVGVGLVGAEAVSRDARTPKASDRVIGSQSRHGAASGRGELVERVLETLGNPCEECARLVRGLLEYAQDRRGITHAAVALGLGNRRGLERRLRRHGFPRLRLLKDWLRLLLVVHAYEEFGISLTDQAYGSGSDPSVLYRLCQRTTGSPWTEVSRAGAHALLSRFGAAVQVHLRCTPSTAGDQLQPS